MAASTAKTLTRTETKDRPKGTSSRQDSKMLDGAVARLGVVKGGEKKFRRGKEPRGGFFTREEKRKMTQRFT